MYISTPSTYLCNIDLIEIGRPIDTIGKYDRITPYSKQATLHVQAAPEL
jgi:hypothetical protein